MSTDRRRILGPADAVRPVAATPAPVAKSDKEPGSVRKFFVKTGLSKNANGSAYLEVGDTIIEVSVFGPRPIKGSFINRATFSVETKFLPYVTQPNEVLFNGGSAQGNGRSGLTNIEQKMSTYVETAFLPALLLEKYPKSTIDVFVNVLSFNSTTCSMLNLISWVVNCTSLAMVDSGIEIRDLVTAGHVNLRSSTNTAVVDALITSEDDESAGTECVASFMAMQNNEMVAVLVQGNDGAGVCEDSLTLSVDACQQMSTSVRKNLNGYLLEMAKQQ
ncbi:hypothetical protein JCM33374_g2671 [Metschnikowia sp. JCM 33374]|nr:hypothetical protein JCM33374_g2671 [Metschnikowia sp. JCM 33374]